MGGSKVSVFAFILLVIGFLGEGGYVGLDLVVFLIEVDGRVGGS